MEGVLRPRGDLSRADRDRMYALFEQHFAGAERAVFERDLQEKDYVLWLTEGEALAGFTTLLFYRFDTIQVVYSGDTIVAPSAWGTTALPRAWIAAVLKLAGGEARLFWLLLSSGYRTYRFLPLFFRQYYPALMDESSSSLAQALALDRFGSRYRQDLGIVRFDSPSRLRPGVGDVTADKLKDPHIAFFVERNPGHAQGDELVCLTEIAHSNLTAAGRRMVGMEKSPRALGSVS